jgi:hypothetical protein
MMDRDYTIKKGRLINNAPELEMGLSKAARFRKEMKRAEKVRMIAEGNELANMNIDLFKKL